MSSEGRLTTANRSVLGHRYARGTAERAMNDDERTLTPEAIRHLLYRRDVAVTRHRAAIARSLGLADIEMLALVHLAEHGALAPSAIASLLDLSSGGATALVQRLERGRPRDTAAASDRSPQRPDPTRACVRQASARCRGAARPWAWSPPRRRSRTISVLPSPTCSRSSWRSARSSRRRCGEMPSPSATCCAGRFRAYGRDVRSKLMITSSQGTASASPASSARCLDLARALERRSQERGQLVAAPADRRRSSCG